MEVSRKTTQDTSRNFWQTHIHEHTRVGIIFTTSWNSLYSSFRSGKGRLKANCLVIRKHKGDYFIGKMPLVQDLSMFQEVQWATQLRQRHNSATPVFHTFSVWSDCWVVACEVIIALSPCSLRCVITDKKERCEKRGWRSCVAVGVVSPTVPYQRLIA